MKKIVKILPKYRIKQNVKNEESRRSTKKKTHEQYVEEVKIKNPDIIVVDKYINSRTKISHKCKICLYTWKVAPKNILNGTGCPECNKIKKGLPRKTHNEYVKEVMVKNPKVIVIGTYIDSMTKILHKCNMCSKEWDSTPHNILSGVGCPSCSKIRTNLNKTHEKYIKEVYNINKNITVIGEYRGSREKIKCKCNKCGHIWESIACSILSGSGCPKCVGRNKTTEDFIEEIANINSDIEIVGQYINSTTPILCKCKICGHQWSPTPSNLHHTGCPVCKLSQGERLIKTFLKNNKISFYHQKKYKTLLGVKNKKLSYDFYLPQYNLLIEFQGKQHERPVEYFGGEEKFKVQQEHDNRKREFAKLHNINLLEIWYYDINNIEKILTETLNNLKLKTVETTGIA